MVGPHLATARDAHLAAERAGYEVLTSPDTAQTIEMARRHRPQVAILEHDGSEDLELMTRLRSEHPECAVIAAVGRQGGIELALRMLGTGALDYLHVPLDPTQLCEALGRVRDRRTARRRALLPTVLVLEDDSFTRERLVRILEREGYLVGSEADGAAGMRAFEKSHYDVILCDLNMPGKNGIEVLREAKANDADVEVILVTGQADERLVIEAMRGGVSNFLCKPIDLDDLFEALDQAFAAQARRRRQRGRRHDLVHLQELLVQVSPSLPLIVHAPEHLPDGPLKHVRDLIDDIPVAILLTTTAGEVLYANARAQRSGFSPLNLPEAWVAAIGDPGEGVLTVQLSEEMDLLVAPLRLVRAGTDTECYAVLVREGTRVPDRLEAR